MPARLVYAPKAYVFTKNAAGEVLNFTPYVTAGKVQRLVNQASTAEVQLRNPKKRFTIPASPTFHPMDPITIYLERLKGYPVQVFTGYLDSTPYYQMYPGTITLQATCTLKKLMYTYWDPALPFINAFLQKYGWINNNGALTNVPALGNTGTVGKGGTLQDGSIGKLLWAILTDVAEWNDTNIWIENLPAGDNGIANRIAALMAQLATDEENAANELSAFMQTIIGSQSFGSGGTQSSGATNVPSVLSGNSNAQKAFNYFVQQGLSPQAAAGIVGNWQQESGVNPADAGGYIAQWGGSRLTALQSWAAAAGKPITDLGVQLSFAWHELNTGYTSALAGLRTAKTPAEAAIVFCNIYEEPGDPNNYGYPVYLSKRIQYAQDAYNSFAHGTVVGTSSLGAVTGQGTPPINNPLSAATQAGSSSGSTTGTDGGSTTVIDAMITAAATISNADYPYVWGGGHQSAGTPSTGTGGSTIGYDCSGSVTAVLSAAGLWPKGSSVPRDDNVISQLLSQNIIAPGPGTGSPECTLYDNPGVHIFMRLNGQYWGTSDGSNGNASQPHGGAGWLHDSHSDAQTFNAYHVLPTILSRSATYQGPTGNSSIPGLSSAGGAGQSSAGNVLSQSSAEAFTAEIDFPSIADMTTALILGSAHKGLMHDQQLLPFVQQLAQASMRSFQSLPNGDFFAFYPDYFGETGHRVPYWNIRDIEILDGGINLNDQSLVTHEFAVGDNTYPVNNELTNMLFSAGTITIFNAFMDPTAVGIGAKKQKGGMADVMSQAEAIEFVKRYGARPQVQNFPMVRSPLYEMFLAYQGFLVAWANQFSTPFKFTFMPEVYPGGKVAFPDHGLQMYVQSVTHTWDYAEAGFTTDAVLSAPAAMPGDWPDLPDNMVQALVEPVRAAAAKDPTTGRTKQRNAQTAAGEVSGTGKAISSVSPSKVNQILGAL